MSEKAMSTQPKTKRLAGFIAVLLAFTMFLAACGSSDETAVEPAAEPATDMMGAFGPGCAAVPADGAGSFAGMAEETAATAASNNPLLSTLVTAVVQADLVDTLNSDGPFTIFAPTNDAFAAIPADVLAAVLADKDLLTSVLTYHVIGGESLLADDLAGQSFTTVEGGEVTLSADGTGVNDATVLCSNVPVANGTVHIVDSVLLPQVALDAIASMTAMDEDAMAMMGAFGPACSAVPAEGAGSFAGMAEETAATAASNNPLLSTLVKAVVQADLVDTLNSDGPFTIFAPTNDAFAAIPADVLAAVLADKDLLTSVLTYHVIGGESLLADDLAGQTFTTVEGGKVTLSADGTGVNDATVLCSNVPVANGTVHIVDSVLLPQVALDAIAAMTTGDSADAMLGATGPGCSAVPADGAGSFAGMAQDPAGTAASNNPLLSTLVTAVIEADLVDTLNSDGPFTIFAPVNDAFAALPPADLAAVLADKDLLTSVLTLHVVSGSMSADDLVKAGTATSVQGGELTFEASGDTFTVNGAQVLCENVPVANGTVHIIDAVLLP